MLVGVLDTPEGNALSPLPPCSVVVEDVCVMVSRFGGAQTDEPRLCGGLVREGDKESQAVAPPTSPRSSIIARKSPVFFFCSGAGVKHLQRVRNEARAPAPLEGFEWVWEKCCCYRVWLGLIGDGGGGGKRLVCVRSLVFLFFDSPLNMLLGSTVCLVAANKTGEEISRSERSAGKCVSSSVESGSSCSSFVWSKAPPG